MTITTQDLFDISVNGVLEQGCQSALSNGTCRYRKLVDGEVLKCAVGQVILDEYYSETLEGSIVSNGKVLISVEKSIGRSLTMDEKLLINRLQGCHDSPSNNGNFIANFIRNITQLAKKENLSMENIIEH